MKRIQYIILAGCLFAIQACTRDFEKINTNKAGYVELDPQYQLTKVQLDLSGDMQNVWRYDLGIASATIQHLGGSWWTQHGGMYKIEDKTHWYKIWEATYPRELKNLQNIIEKTSDDPAQANMHSVARIMRVLVFSTITDLYGDIPYSQAIKGFTEKILLPAYDKQEDIYKDFFKELDEAVKGLNTSGPSVEGDLFFDGDIAKWIKFGNSLRLRLGFRLTKINPAEAKKQVEAAISGGVMTSLSDICMMRHEEYSWVTGEHRGNGRSQVFKGARRSEGYRLVSTLVDTLKSNEDPRLYIFGGTYFGDYFVGGTEILDLSGYAPARGTRPGAFAWSNWVPAETMPGPNGPVSVTLADRFMQPSKYVSARNAPFFHLTPAEVEFLLAEAALRGWGGVTNAEGHFKNGLQFACEAANLYPGTPTIQQSAIDQFKSHYEPFPSNVDTAMRNIHTQMWVNFFLNGTEAYANWRRTGYPKLQRFTGVDSYSPGALQIPRRYFYPEFEILQNPKNYQDAISRMNNSNDYLTPVWWDKQ